MANLDTENKRRSATGIFHLYTIPKYDGGTDGVDREHVTYIYAGIAPGAAVAAAWIPVGMMMGVYRMKKIA
jgi:hypothetical protein